MVFIIVAELPEGPLVLGDGLCLLNGHDSRYILVLG